MKSQIILILLFAVCINGLMLQTDSFTYDDGILIVSDYQIVEINQAISSEIESELDSIIEDLYDNGSEASIEPETIVVENESISVENESASVEFIDPMYEKNDTIEYIVELNDSILVSDEQNFTISIANYFDQEKSIDIEAYYYYYSVKYSNIYVNTFSVDARQTINHTFALNLTEYRDGLKLKIKLKKSELVTFKDFKYALTYDNSSLLENEVVIENSTDFIGNISLLESDGLNSSENETLSEFVELDDVVTDFDSVIESVNDSVKEQLIEKNHSFLLNNTLENILSFQMDDFFESIVNEVERIDLENNIIYMKSGLNFTFNSTSSDVDLLNKWVGGSSNHSLMSTLSFIENSRTTKKKISYNLIIFGLPFVIIGIGIFQKYWSVKRAV